MYVKVVDEELNVGRVFSRTIKLSDGGVTVEMLINAVREIGGVDWSNVQ